MKAIGLMLLIVGWLSVGVGMWLAIVHRAPDAIPLIVYGNVLAVASVFVLSAAGPPGTNGGPG
jgi:hypothetical protein